MCHDNHDKLDFESSLPVLKIALSNKEKTKTYFSKMAETLKYSDASKPADVVLLSFSTGTPSSRVRIVVA